MRSTNVLAALIRSFVFFVKRFVVVLHDLVYNMSTSLNG